MNIPIVSNLMGAAPTRIISGSGMDQMLTAVLPGYSLITDSFVFGGDPLERQEVPSGVARLLGTVDTFTDQILRGSLRSKSDIPLSTTFRELRPGTNIKFNFKDLPREHSFRYFQGGRQVDHSPGHSMEALPSLNRSRAYAAFQREDGGVPAAFRFPDDFEVAGFMRQLRFTKGKRNYWFAFGAVRGQWKVACLDHGLQDVRREANLTLNTVLLSGKDDGEYLTVSVGITGLRPVVPTLRDLLNAFGKYIVRVEV